MSPTEFNALNEDERQTWQRIGYLSKNTGRWIYPPKDDPALYTNHSKENNLSAILNKSISEEPIFIANRDIATGEELTNDYREFDDLTKDLETQWSK